MNRLLQKERSIVTGVPGTTRDFIEETVNIGGVPMRLIDTAGVHDTEDALEMAGIRFTMERMDDAGIVLFMVDCSVPLNDDDVDIYNVVRNREAILVINKIDLGDEGGVGGIVDRLKGLPWVEISALYNKGIEELKSAVFRVVTYQGGFGDVPSIVPNVRHKVAIERAVVASKRVVAGLGTGLPAELLAIDLKEALEGLGEIVGETTTEDVLDKIFKRFCVGK
ncbi:MAG: hypothetical protein BA861_03085 [Desulfobacterales bacterium S3730MH5]|nr:MAG: hypothetical protein BA861_03085 [Desulfobacterales bacterium S3730MH5]